MRIFHSDRYTLPLPPGHRFPMRKYQALHARVRRQADPDWQLHEAPPASRAALTRVHTAAYVAQVLEHGIGAAAERRLGLPWSPALAARSLHSVGGTLAACAAAHTDGIAVNLAGGTHHAGATAGAGFCVFNDVAVAALDALHSGAARHVLVVDCDVHQGDGTAALLATHPAAYTFSIHAARNYPHRKARSRLDIALPDRCGDADYLDLLAAGLEHALAVARPGLAIYLAGADPWAGDRLGRLALSKPGIAARDELVLRALEAAGCRVAVVMGGGYADAVTDIVDIHMGTVRAAG
ncbi:MAG: histone deacetylase, partial [Gammaproteobacteria bacterium]